MLSTSITPTYSVELAPLFAIVLFPCFRLSWPLPTLEARVRLLAQHLARPSTLKRRNIPRLNFNAELFFILIMLNSSPISIPAKSTHRKYPSYYRAVSPMIFNEPGTSPTIYLTIKDIKFLLVHNSVYRAQVSIYICSVGSVLENISVGSYLNIKYYKLYLIESS